MQRIAAASGAERIQQRDEQSARYRRRELPAGGAAPPAVVAVEVDGGHVRTRAPDCGPGVHPQQNQEDKLACLVHRDSTVQEHARQPQPPRSFLEPRRVQRRVQQRKGPTGDLTQEEAGQEATSAPGPATARPQRRLRTCVASRADRQAFGLLVAAEAQERDFFHAARAAFLGDGAAYPWWIQRAYFPNCEALTDLLHLLCYL